MRKLLYTVSAQGLLLALIAVTPAFAQGPPGGRGMMKGDASHSADMQLFHQLFEHRAEINRQVITRADGIETVTESKVPEVTRLLQAHVVAAQQRVRMDAVANQSLGDDPTVPALGSEPTVRGVRIIETSKDAYVVKLLHAHAEVVSAFLANGMSEMMKNHPVPPR